MKQRETCKYLFDMAESCKKRKEFTADQDIESYQNSAMLRSAVERQFEIIGEAMGQLLRRSPEWESRISNSRRIIAFRNVLIHGYADVDDELVWGVVETQLDTLDKEVSTLLAEIS
jgi:uncharacterized protein with HEPN domain